jgi:hypothetical protein
VSEVTTVMGDTGRHGGACGARGRRSVVECSGDLLADGNADRGGAVTDFNNDIALDRVDGEHRMAGIVGVRAEDDLEGRAADAGRAHRGLDRELGAPVDVEVDDLSDQLALGEVQLRYGGGGLLGHLGHLLVRRKRILLELVDIERRVGRHVDRRAV